LIWNVAVDYLGAGMGTIIDGVIAFAVATFKLQGVPWLHEFSLWTMSRIS
jgi:hypothetical protein